MKTVGIIGGLGPETTALFYSELMRRVDRLRAAHRAGALIYSVPLPYEMEREAICFGRGQARLVPLLKEAAQRLEAGGASFLVMPCNSLHIFLEEIRAAVRIPVISLIDETVSFAENLRIDCLGIVGTRITITSGIYQQALLNKGIKVLVPDELQLDSLGELIHQLVMGNTTGGKSAILEVLAREMEEQGATHVLLACTDLQLLLRERHCPVIIDTLDVLLRATLREIQGSLDSV